MSDDLGLLTPGAHRARHVADDAALVSAMVRVELGWLRALARAAALPVEDVKQAEQRLATWKPDLGRLAAQSEDAGNPVLPLVREVRLVVGEDLAKHVHRGLTSQDVLDTALILLARDSLQRVKADLATTARDLAETADLHRATIMVGRTLTQYAVPITFGLKSAQWLTGIMDALDEIDQTVDALPVQCGGAAGTLALTQVISGDGVEVAVAFADELALSWPGLPWHTRRTPITRIGDALVRTTDALGVIATDIALLTRPEIGELSEGIDPARGGSSTMPHKRNPVLTVLVRSAALQAPLLGAQLHLAAAQAVDERPDGAWHAEWPSFRRLLELAVTAASQAAELVSDLAVDEAAMASRVAGAAELLTAEIGDGREPHDYLGAAATLIDTALHRATTLGLSGHG